jgi:recombinational DNA repair ATPase RecF
VNDAVLSSVLARLGVEPLAEQAEAVLLAALDGDETLLRQPAGDPVTPRRNEHAGDPPPPVPVGAYLQSVTVAGFRGIAPATTLRLTPGPGLTVICGRNGSGKSSFAEALEVLLTGDTVRWQKGRAAVQRDTWRCVHAPRTEISAELLVEGTRGATVLRRSWQPDDRKVGDALTTVHAPRSAPAGIDALGWDDAVTTHRPFLSHAELESLLAEPKELYSQLNSLLGLEDVDDALTRLAGARKDADGEAKRARVGLPDLRAELAGTDDERAVTAAALLAARAPDLDGLRALAAGAPVDTGPLQILTHLAGLTVPTVEDVEEAATGLRDAFADLDAVRRSAAGAVVATADLLQAALDHTADTGDPSAHDRGVCPVCGTAGVIDGEWRRRTTEEVARLRAASADTRRAQNRVEVAGRAVRLLVGGPAPAWLARAADAGLDATAAGGSWGRWAALGAGDMGREVADRLGPLHVDLERSVTDLADAARAELAARQDRWTPLATRITEWCDQAARSSEAKDRFGLVKAAEDWLKAAAADLRHERLRPFADRTVELWNQLRQGSNVDLVEVRLAGAANRSHVDFAVTVDDEAATGLGVMSQGEINALALSVFLPRATMASSPFRFLVIDDPVQAMDPSKVDGLARVLADTAADRQVIVFTHDDRLAEAVRRLGLDASILLVSRRPGSVVAVDPAGNPCSQLLRDARQLTRGDGVPLPVARRVIPGLCRSAIETVLIDAIRRRRLAAGASHVDVEAAIADTNTLTAKAALAIFDDAQRGGDVLRWLADTIGQWAVTTYRIANRGAHGDAGSFDAERLVSQTGDLTARLRDGLP